jgi:hypothetical protein
MGCYRRVTPVPMIVPSHAEGAPGPSLLGTGDVDTMQSQTSTRLPGAPCLDFQTWETTNLNPSYDRCFRGLTGPPGLIDPTFTRFADNYDYAAQNDSMPNFRQIDFRRRRPSSTCHAGTRLKPQNAPTPLPFCSNLMKPGMFH